MNKLLVLSSTLVAFVFLSFLDKTASEQNLAVGFLSVQAQSDTQTIQTPLIFNNSSTNENRGESTNTENAPRGRKAEPPFGENDSEVDCSALVNPEQPLTSLVPGIEDRYFTSRTLSERPVLWFYIPEVGEVQAEFTLLTADNLYQKSFDLSSTGSIVGLQLPTNILLENTDRDYEWALTIVCDEYDPAGNPYVTGKIRRVEQSLTISNQTFDEQIRLFASNGLWHETLTTIATELYAEDSQLAQSLLRELFSSASVDLEYVQDRPILEVIELPEE